MLLNSDEDNLNEKIQLSGGSAEKSPKPKSLESKTLQLVDQELTR